MDRTIRIAAELQKTLCDIIRSDLKDPRIPLVTSVTDVKLTKDLQFAKAYVSMFGTEAEKAAGMEALKQSAGFIRYRVGKRMIIRQLPELSFELDNSVEEGVRMSAIIDKVIENDKKGKEEK